MQSHLGHLVFGVQPAHMPFYKDLLTFMGWSTIYDSPDMCGFGDKNHVSLWFGAATKAGHNDYDAPGVNHVAVGTAQAAQFCLFWLLAATLASACVVATHPPAAYPVQREKVGHRQHQVAAG